jgi:hypothetical protein
MDKQHLAACHCKTTHPELFLYKKDGTNLSFRSDDLKDKIEYVENECEDALRWKDIPLNSKDYIWPLYCPIYGTIKQWSPTKLKSDNALRNLLEDGWKILKTGGKLMIHISTGIPSDTMKESLTTWNKKNGNNSWKVDIVDKDSLDFFIHDSRKPKFTQYISLTKLDSGGKRKKTLRNKIIRNATKYRRIR